MGVRRLICVLALVAGVSALVPSASAGYANEPDPGRGIGVRLVDVPVAAADNPRARVYIIDHVRPGSIVERRVEVVNYTRDPVDVAMYPAAADVRAGEFIGAEGHTRNLLSSWTSVAPSSPRLSPGVGAFTKVRIEVPDDAPEGEQYAVVWAEVSTPPSTTGGVTHVSRVGVRIYLSVGPGGEPSSDFDIRSFTASRDDAGAPVVQVLVRNIGGRALDLTGQLKLSDGPGGLSAGPFDMTLGTTLGIGATEPITAALDDTLPNGPWRAHVTVRSGLLQHTAGATLTFPDGPGVAAPVAVESTGSIPWPMLVAVVAGVLALLALLGWHRRCRRTPAKSSDPHEVMA